MWNLRSIPRNVASWHVTSHHNARRNALVASTALASRRRERIEAEEFLERHLASVGAAPTVGSATGGPATGGSSHTA